MAQNYFQELLNTKGGPLNDARRGKIKKEPLGLVLISLEKNSERGQMCKHGSAFVVSAQITPKMSMRLPFP